MAESLQRHGAKVWLDELEVSPGEPLRDAIEKGLRRSDIVVSVVTPEGIKRPNLFFELGAAVGMGKRVVAILPQGFEPTLLPQLLRTRRFLRQGSPEETARELLGQATSGEELKGERA